MRLEENFLFFGYKGETSLFPDGKDTSRIGKVRLHELKTHESKFRPSFLSGRDILLVGLERGNAMERVSPHPTG